MGSGRRVVREIRARGILAEGDGLQVAERKVRRAAAESHTILAGADLPPSHKENNDKDASLCALRG